MSVSLYFHLWKVCPVFEFPFCVKKEFTFLKHEVMCGVINQIDLQLWTVMFLNRISSQQFSNLVHAENRSNQTVVSVESSGIALLPCGAVYSFIFLIFLIMKFRC